MTWVTGNTTGAQMAQDFNNSDINIARASESGVVSGLDVVAISNTEIQITAGVFDVVNKVAGTITRTTVASAINIKTTSAGVPGPFPPSGSWYVTIKKYDGTWVDVNKRFDFGTTLTVEWFSSRPAGRGPATGGVTLNKVFFVGTTLTLGADRIYVYDGIEHYKDQVIGAGGRGCALSTNADTLKFNVNTFLSYRTNAYGAGIHAGNSLATTDVSAGIFRSDGVTRGISMRGHLFNLLDSSGGSNDYIANAAIITGGTYALWWKYLDATRTVSPGAGLLPTAAGSNRWVLHWIGMFAGKNTSQNPILIWAPADYSSEAAALSQPIPSLNSRSLDLTILGGCLINTNSANLSSAQWIAGPRFNNWM